LKKAYHAGGVQRQQLLFPEVFELDYKSAAALEENLVELERLGFEVEPFGGKSFAVKALPALLAAAPVVTLVTDVALELERVGQALLADLDVIDFKGHCPHGRPVIARMGLYEIERLFRRHG